MTGRHQLQLYGDLTSLTENVTAYLADGVLEGDQLIVVATPEHHRAFERRLAEKDVDIPGLLRDGRLKAFDARETLAGFMVDGRPAWDRFEATVGSLVRASILRAAGGGVRAYGEMVDVLWGEGKVEAAIELEGCWNRLLELERFSLFCAYGIDFLAPETATVLRTHTHPLPARTNGELGRAVDGAMREALGGAAVDALLPLIRASLLAPATHPGPEATILWLRAHLPRVSHTVMSRARILFEAEREAVAR